MTKEYINLKDSLPNQKCSLSKSQYDSLMKISDKTLVELDKEWHGGNLLIYPHSFIKCKDEVGNLKILKIEGKVDDGQYHILSDRLIGFINVDDVEINIHSRFDNFDDDYFFYYMLSRVLSMNVFDMQHNTAHEKILNLLFLLFRNLLNNAVSQGIFKEYVTRKYDDSRVRGVIDTSRYIKTDTPFHGSVAYHNREFSYDNHVTQIIRHTIEFIRKDIFGHRLLESDRLTRENVAQICQSTPSYSQQQWTKVIGQNLRRMQNPFFTKYIPLQTLCIQILRHEKIRFGNENRPISGVLFDSAWLWEEYLNKVLTQQNFIHPENKLSKNGLRLCSHAYTRYPDFYRGSEYGLVLDAKYKSVIDRNDVNQMIAYMYRLKSLKGMFVQPSETPKDAIESHLLGYGKGMNSVLGKLFLTIPQNCCDLRSFETQIRRNEEENLLNKLAQTLPLSLSVMV